MPTWPGRDGGTTGRGRPNGPVAHVCRSRFSRVDGWRAPSRYRRHEGRRRLAELSIRHRRQPERPPQVGALHADGRESAAPPAAQRERRDPTHAVAPLDRRHDRLPAAEPHHRRRLQRPQSLPRQDPADAGDRARPPLRAAPRPTRPGEPGRAPRTGGTGQLPAPPRPRPPPDSAIAPRRPARRRSRPRGDRPAPPLRPPPSRRRLPAARPPDAPSGSRRATRAPGTRPVSCWQR